MADRPNILIIFTSWSGNTEALAEAIAGGARGAGNGNVDVTVKRAGDTGRGDIEKASALAFGSPTYYSYMSGEMKTLFDKALPFRDAFYKKPAIAFATGNGGQQKCIESIERILEFFEVTFVQRSDILSAGLAVQGKPDEGALRQAKAIGRKLGDAGIAYACSLGRKNIITG
ncbi:MAG TPA: flavodoxin domain-containing protein [Methanocella sp.]|uniref:flavodoxin family protein n=1 Tax=Methanocella sp. TaxID=2052833 RepID=UPI002D0A3377|nr:flavodoxin domain-containing protein [Methanocella sp.]HTY91853.1 flavodoxin domain-containing protein [Methanocella sp.]